MPIAGATIFSMKISPTATKLDSVVCFVFFTFVFDQMVFETSFQVNISFVKGSILRDWTDFSDACDFHCKNLRKTSKSVSNSFFDRGADVDGEVWCTNFWWKKWHSCFQKVVKMHEFLCVKRYFCQGCLTGTALNKMIQIALKFYFLLMFNLLHKLSLSKIVVSQPRPEKVW